MQDFGKRVFQILKDLPEFQKYVLELKTMDKLDKKEFYSYAIIHVIHDAVSHTKYLKEATIYLNYKDLITEEQIIQAFAHEGSHILNDGEEVEKKLYGKIIKELKKGDEDSALECSERP